MAQLHHSFCYSQLTYFLMRTNWAENEPVHFDREQLQTKQFLTIVFIVYSGLPSEPYSKQILSLGRPQHCEVGQWWLWQLADIFLENRFCRTNEVQLCSKMHKVWRNQINDSNSLEPRSFPFWTSLKLCQLKHEKTQNVFCNCCLCSTETHNFVELPNHAKILQTLDVRAVPILFAFKKMDDLTVLAGTCRSLWCAMRPKRRSSQETKAIHRHTYGDNSTKQKGTIPWETCLSRSLSFMHCSTFSGFHTEVQVLLSGNMSGRIRWTERGHCAHFGVSTELMFKVRPFGLALSPKFSRPILADFTTFCVRCAPETVTYKREKKMAWWISISFQFSRSDCGVFHWRGSVHALFEGSKWAGNDSKCNILERSSKFGEGE